jgi:predicted mannosyl-3-phosphoglycerate phosphatase (HAD superfamily)
MEALRTSRAVLAQERVACVTIFRRERERGARRREKIEYNIGIA